MDALVRRIDAEIRSVPGVRLVLATSGGSFLGAVNEARVYVGLVPHEARVFSLGRLAGGLLRADPGAAFRDNRSQRAVMQEVRRRLGRAAGEDVRIQVRNPAGFRFAGGFIDIDFVLRGPDLDALAAYTERLRQRGDDLGLVDAPGPIGLRWVPRAGGGLARLDNLVTLTPAWTASRIDRLDRHREARLRANVAPGYALADRVQPLRDEVVRMDLPPGDDTIISGRARELERTFGELVWAFALSIVFMYMILAAQFESLVHPLTILLSLPLSLPFALLSLWLTGNTLNLYSSLGILVLFGVVKKNAILQIDHMNTLRAAG